MQDTNQIFLPQTMKADMHILTLHSEPHLGIVEQLSNMQVSMQCAEQMGCDDSIIKFVLPLGTTVNMNGTALYEATTVIFIAQVSSAWHLSTA